MELAGLELTFERVLLLLFLVLFFAFLVVTQAELREIKQQSQGTQAELREIKQQSQGTQAELREIKRQTLVELKQLKEDVPHREFSSRAGSLSPFTLPSLLPHKTSNSLPPRPFCVVMSRSVFGNV